MHRQPTRLNSLCKQIQRECLHCGTIFWATNYTVQKGNGRYCSRRCVGFGWRGRPKHGDPAHRFWSRVRKTSGCWLWTGSFFDKGYGAFWSHGKQRHAHVVAWELTNGPVQTGRQVLHTCDVRACCNPGHLFLGDAKVNADDMMAKGRQGNNKPKLDWDKAQQIRAQYKTGQYTHHDLASQFGVKVKAIRDILWNKTYRVTTGPSK